MGDSGVVYMNSGAAVGGKVADLKSLVDSFDNSKRTAPQALLDLVGTLPGTSHIWAASLQPASLIQLAAPSERPAGGGSGMAGNLARMGRRVSELTMWGDLSQGLEMHVAAVAGSDSDAAELRDVLRSGIQIGRLSAQDSRPETLQFYEGLTAAADGRVLRIDVKEPLGQLETLLDGLWPAGGRPKP
jgi:hypothetical protein